MLRDLSYKDSEIDKEINNLIGKEFNFLEKIRRGGTGSRQLIIKKSDIALKTHYHLHGKIFFNG